MNPLLAAIACHRAAQVLVRHGCLDSAAQAYAQRDAYLREARALYNLTRRI